MIRELEWGRTQNLKRKVEKELLFQYIRSTFKCKSHQFRRSFHVQNVGFGTSIHSESEIRSAIRNHTPVSIPCPILFIW